MDGIGIKFPKVVGLRFLLDIQVEMLNESGGKESHGLERSAGGVTGDQAMGPVGLLGELA